MTTRTHLLVIGAGPFGLAVAAYARHLGLDCQVVGRPMEFWKENMPDGMYLRSASDWHLDATGAATIEEYLRGQGLTATDVEPLSRAFYLDYVEWFRQKKQIEPIPAYVQRLDRGGEGKFVATLDDGTAIAADNVVIAVGFKYFTNVPPEYAALLPAGRYAHTCDRVDFGDLRGKRCLILGGRQSAFEWAALIHEAGAATIHVVHRHASPAFAQSDWSWVNPIVDAIATNPGWYRGLTQEDKDAVGYRLWAEGRLKVEPWLERRVVQENVHIWSNARVTGCAELPDGALAVTLDNGQTLTADNVILATGYKVRIEQVPFLAAGNLLPDLAVRNGFPVLDEHFQTSIPGLYITSMAAAQDFGPFWGFTIAVRTSARLIGEALGRPA